VYTSRVDAVLREDGDAVAGARRGDSAAFGVLVERYQEVAFRAAYLIVRDAGIAEDVAQEAFVRAFRKIDGFRAGEPFRPWLLRIVTNVALNEVRARTRRRGLFERAAVFADREMPSAVEALEAQDEASLVLRAINELPTDDRLVLYLRYFLELPEQEIAQTIGKAPGTVKSRLHRASGRLRALIEQKYPQLRERDDG
ncbi:MAG: RNA polymerase sigma factor, partial [Gemmatimonadaceae bacterium]